MPSHTNVLPSQPTESRRAVHSPLALRGFRRFGLALALVTCTALLGCVKSHSVAMTADPAAAQAYTSATAGGGIWVSDAELVQVLSGAASRARPDSPPTSDGRLAQLAAQIGRRLGPTGLLPSSTEIGFLARRAGVFEPAVGAFVIAQGEPAVVADNLTKALAERAGRRPLTHFGMAPVRSYGDSLWVVVWTGRRLTLDEVPRSAPVGTPLTIKGTLASGLRNPRVRVVVGAAADRLPAGEGPHFEVRLPTPQPGVYEIEVSAEDDGNRKLLAVMPVYVGIRPPDAPSEEVQVQSAEQVEQAAIAALQQTRQAAGLQALVVDDALVRAARAHSAAMAEGAFVGHNDSAGHTPAERVLEAGLDAALVLENVGRTRDVGQLHQEFGAHPGQRGAMLHPQVGRVGVGVVAVSGGDRPIYYVTELFVGVVESIDLSSAGEVVLGHLNRARAARAAPPLSLDDALSAVAQDGAVAYFEQPYPSQQVLVDRANAELGDFSIAFERAAAVMTVVHSIAEAATLELALEAGATHVGVAVAQGSRPGAAAQSTALFITLGWGRQK